MRFVLGCVLAVCLMFQTAAADTLDDNLSRYTDETAAGYLAPLSEAFGQNLNTGYFTTAAIPQNGFYIRFSLQVMNVRFGNDDKTFVASPPPDFPSDETVVAPTVVGDGESVDLYGEGGAKFTFPGGLGFGNEPLAVPQLIIGSVNGTEAVIRWFGFDTGSDDFEKIEFLGLGVRHSLSQYFEDFPVELAASVMYQTFKVRDDLIDGKAFAFGAQASKEYGMLEPFASLTLDTWSNSTRFTANEGTEDEEIRNLDFDSKSNLHLALGTSANLSFMRLWGAVNMAGKFGWNAGLSFGN